MIRAALILAVGAILSACAPSAPRTGFAGDRGRGFQIASARCSACHGPEGAPVQPGTPKLGEQWPEYLKKQLLAFASPASAPNHRVSAVMAPIAAALSDRDMADVSAWYSEVSRNSSAPADPARFALGRELFLHGSPQDDLPACASCHRPDGGGIRPDFPNLAGQDPDYTERQLAQWEAMRGHRGKLMTLIVPHLRPNRRGPIADYIATLKSRPVE
jgi:cytochrome c553